MNTHICIEVLSDYRPCKCAVRIQSCRHSLCFDNPRVMWSALWPQLVFTLMVSCWSDQNLSGHKLTSKRLIARKDFLILSILSHLR